MKDLGTGFERKPIVRKRRWERSEKRVIRKAWEKVGKIREEGNDQKRSEGLGEGGKDQRRERSEKVKAWEKLEKIGYGNMRRPRKTCLRLSD